MPNLVMIVALAYFPIASYDYCTIVLLRKLPYTINDKISRNKTFYIIYIKLIGKLCCLALKTGYSLLLVDVYKKCHHYLKVDKENFVIYWKCVKYSFQNLSYMVVSYDCCILYTVIIVFNFDCSLE